MTWIKIKERLPRTASILIAKRKNGEQVKCYFHGSRTRPTPSLFHGYENRFQHFETLQFLDDIDEWKIPEDRLDAL